MTSLSGFTTCILTNNYLDDSTQRGHMAQLMCELRPHFDFLIESCQIGMVKPDPQIYRFTLDTLKASPKEVRGCCFSVEILYSGNVEKDRAGEGCLGPGRTILGPVAGSTSPRPGLLKDFHPSLQSRKFYQRWALGSSLWLLQNLDQSGYFQSF